MKKLTYILSAIFVLLVASCTNELETNMQDRKLSFSSINASMADLPTSRAHLEGGGKVVWDNGDRVGIFSDTQTTPMMFECTNINESNASFTSENEVSGSNFFAYYPYENTTVNGNTMTYTLSNTTEYKAGTYFRQCPMIAKSATNEFGFKHTCGIIRFSITGTQRIQSLILEGNNGEIISGTGTIDFSAETPVLVIPSDATDASKTITMTMNNLQMSSTATDFYFVVPEVTFTGGLSLTINYLNDDSSVTPIKKSTTKSITVSRSVIKSFSAIDTDALVQEKEEETYAALMAFYNATEGDNWTSNTNWGSDKPFSEWYGILTNQFGLVVDINLDNNNLTGYIPESIGDLKQLESISLSSNKLTGELPVSIGDLTELKYLYVYDNNLRGRIPESICNLMKLEMVNLDMNGLSGELPTAIGNLTELRSFCAMNNNLTGSIPESICNLINLEILYLDSNQLTGELPISIGNLIKLSHFMVGFNNLTGTIPESINKMKSLTNFYIRSNYFTGMVPECLMEMDTWPTGWHEILDQRGEGFSKEGLVIPAPKFSENTIEGEVLDYSVYSKNEFTILYHYFDWCHWSHDFTPTLVELYNGYKNKGLEVIAFSGEGTIESNRKFAETYNTKWPYITLSNNKDIFNAHTWISPGVCVVDKDGYIIFNSLTYDWRDLGTFLYEKLGPLDSSEPSDTPLFYESTDYSKDGEVKQLQKATKGKGINIVLMGDAYSDRLITDGTYDQTMQSAMEAFFNVEPYKSFRDHFNVFSVVAVSKNEIYSQHSETVFKGYFGEDTQVGGNDSIVFSYALKAVSEEQMDEALIVVMMNSLVYAGTCYMYVAPYGDWGNGVSVSYFPVGEDTESIERLIHHEAAGHGFAKLADEYAYYDKGHIPNEEVEACRTVSQYGWWKNVDFTSDTNTIRWNHFISDTRYANEGLGAYEGGLTYWTGVWRPTENSIMRYNTGGFNAPSREAIYYRIHKLAYGKDWQYDYEKFVEYDAINRNTTSARSVDKPVYYEPLHAPIVIRHSWKDAK